MSFPNKPEARIIDNIPTLHVFQQSIQPGCHLFIDVQGRDPTTKNHPVFLTILVQPSNIIGMIDLSRVDTSYLDKSPGPFDTGFNARPCLLDRIRDPSITKYFWDLQDKADILPRWSVLNFPNVIDVQLSEVAAHRPHTPGRLIRDLSSAIQDLRLPFQDSQSWHFTNQNIPDSQRHPNEWTSKPLSHRVWFYCISRVEYLPHLQTLYWSRLTEEAKIEVRHESAARLRISRFGRA